MKLPFTFKLNLNARLNLQKISVIIGCYLFFVLPFAFLLFHFNTRLTSLQQLQDATSQLAIRIKDTKQTEKTSFMPENSHEAIDHVLQTMTFLKPEIEALKLMSVHPALHSCEEIKSRLETLTGGENRITLTAQNRDIKNGIEEVELVQTRPVEINTNDLKLLLSALEGPSIGNAKARTQVVIKEFHLNKKKLEERETYLLQMQLIKRGS